jgi:hypothetical protein
MALHVLVMRATQESFARVKSIIAPRCLASIMAHVCRFLEISFALVLLVYDFIRFHYVYNCLKKNFYVFLGHTGTFCEKQVDLCSTQPCVHGSCFPLVNDYVCQVSPVDF